MNNNMCAVIESTTTLHTFMIYVVCKLYPNLEKLTCSVFFILCPGPPAAAVRRCGRDEDV